MLKLLLFGFGGSSGCFFAVYWLPFARIPFTMEAFLQSILNPLEFFLGCIAFLIGILCHAKVIRIFLRSILNKAIAMFLFAALCILSPLGLTIFSVKVVIAFYAVSLLYAMISRESESTNAQKVYGNR